MKKQQNILVILCLLLAVLGNAQTAEEGTLDSVILVTTLNYPDAIVAGAASSLSGIPVLLTPKEDLPQEVKDFLTEEKPSTVYIMGGTGVISQDIEDYLTENGFEIQRLWGLTRFGTAAEIAKAFWLEGAETAVLVTDILNAEDGTGFEHALLDASKELAKADQLPVFLTSPEELATETQTALSELGITKVILVGKVEDNVTKALEEMSITVETLSADAIDDTIDKVREKVVEKIKEKGVDSDKLIVVATRKNNFRSSLALPAELDLVIKMLVSDDSEVAEVIDFIKENGIKEVKIVGVPDLVSAIAAQTLLIEDISVEAISTKDIEKKVAERMESMKAKFQEKRAKRVSERKEKLAKNKDKFVERVGDALEEAQSKLDEIEQALLDMAEQAETDDEKAAVEEAKKVLEKAKTLVDAASTAYDEAVTSGEVVDYEKVLKLVMRAKSLSETAQWQGINEFYEGDDDERWRIIEENLERERRGIDDFLDEYLREEEHFLEFTKTLEEEGILPEECETILEKGGELRAEGEEAYEAGEYRDVKIIANKLRKMMKQCMILARKGIKGDESLKSIFDKKLKEHRNEIEFENRQDVCIDRCQEEQDRCYEKTDRCSEEVDRIAERCEKGADRMRARCSEIDWTVIDEKEEKCLSRCAEIEDEYESEFCETTCYEAADKARELAENCEDEVTHFEDACYKELEHVEEMCNNAESGICDNIMEMCMPKCVGAKYLKDTGRAKALCAVNCRGNLMCLKDCNIKLLEQGHKEEVREKCEEGTREFVHKCADKCVLEKCTSGKGDCRMVEKCFVKTVTTSNGKERKKEVCETKEICHGGGACEDKCLHACKEEARGQVFRCMAKQKAPQGDAIKECFDVCADSEEPELCIEDCVGERKRGEAVGLRCRSKCARDKNPGKCMFECTKSVAVGHLDEFEKLKRVFQSDAVKECEEICTIEDDGSQDPDMPEEDTLELTPEEEELIAEVEAELEEEDLEAIEALVELESSDITGDSTGSAAETEGRPPLGRRMPPLGRPSTTGNMPPGDMGKNMPMLGNMGKNLPDLNKLKDLAKNKCDFNKDGKIDDKEKLRCAQAAKNMIPDKFKDKKFEIPKNLGKNMPKPMAMMDGNLKKMEQIKLLKLKVMKLRTKIAEKKLELYIKALRKRHMKRLGRTIRKVVRHEVRKTVRKLRHIDQRCVAQCVKKKMEHFMEEHKAKMEEEKMCSSNMDCGDLMCPMVMGQDTPLCIESACVCGASAEFFMEGEMDVNTEEICDETCGWLPEDEKGFCYEECLGIGEEVEDEFIGDIIDDFDASSDGYCDVHEGETCEDSSDCACAEEEGFICAIDHEMRDEFGCVLELCADGDDNDLDGLTDADDPDCDQEYTFDEEDYLEDYTSEEMTDEEIMCDPDYQEEIDFDGDGIVDECLDLEIEEEADSEFDCGLDEEPIYDEETGEFLGCELIEVYDDYEDMDVEIGEDGEVYIETDETEVYTDEEGNTYVYNEDGTTTVTTADGEVFITDEEGNIISYDDEEMYDDEEPGLECEDGEVPMDWDGDGIDDECYYPEDTEDEPTDGEDPCEGLSEEECFCMENPDSEACIEDSTEPEEDPCEGLSEEECFCMENPDSEACIEDPTEPEEDPCEGLSEEECFCMENPDSETCIEDPCADVECPMPPEDCDGEIIPMDEPDECGCHEYECIPMDDGDIDPDNPDMDPDNPDMDPDNPDMYI